jgi:transporter family protein
MTSQTAGLIVGGLMPALVWGVYNTMIKATTRAGIAVGPFLITVGIATAVNGTALLFVIPDRSVSLRSGSLAVLTGIIWAVAAGLVAFALIRFNAAISQLTPLFSISVLVTVLLGLVLFSEWREVNAPRLLEGSALVVLGALLVSTS